MAYFYTSNCSNYPQIYDNNYQFYHHQYNNNTNNNYDSSNHDYSRYVHYNYNETQFHGNNAYYYQQSPNPSLVGYYYSNYYQPESKNNAYFHENGGDYYYDDVVSTQYIVSYDTTTTTTTNGEAKKFENEVFFEEYNPEPFHGGYDINVTYGKPLPPSDDICYPISKNEVVVNNPNVPSLDDNKRIVESEVDVSKQINDDDVVDDDEFDDDDDDDDDDEFDEDEFEEEKDDLGKETMMVAPIASLGDALDKKVDGGEKKDDFEKEKKKSVSFEDEIHEKDNNNKNQNLGEVIQVETPSKIEAEKEQEQEQEQGKKEEMNGSHDEIRRQIPAGYGMESLDLCEGLFGGYFPCLWKRKQRNNNIEENSCSYNYYEAKLSEYDYDYCCKDTVDYLFGNPNPYGGSMPEKGSYGDPVYSYHRHYPQQPVTEQVDCYGGSSSWLQSSSRYYYGHNNGDYYQ